MDTAKAQQPQEDQQSSRASLEAESPLYKTDEFRMYCFKVLPCSKRYCHDWTTCPFAHPGEKAKRRDPRVYQYTGIACPEMKKNLACPRGEPCPYAHNVFEYWLHPSRYRTQLCNDGVNCKRKVCFFAHTLEELRVPSCKPVLPDSAADAGRTDSDQGFPLQPYASTGDAGLPGALPPGGAGSPVSTLGTGGELWGDAGGSPAGTPTSTWSPYAPAGGLPYADLPADSSSSSLLSQPSPQGGNPAALEQLAQTLAALNLAQQQQQQQSPAAPSAEQPLALLQLLMNQQQPPASPQHHHLAPAQQAAAAAAALMPGGASPAYRAGGYGRGPAGGRASMGGFPGDGATPSPSAAILGSSSSNKMAPPPVPYHQSSLYSPGVPTLAQLQQAAQQAQAVYAAELESIRRRSLDSATRELYNRTLAAQQLAGSRRSLDTYASQMGRSLQQRWPSEAENTIAMAQFALQQQQLLHLQQQQQAAAHAQHAQHHHHHQQLQQLQHQQRQKDAAEASEEAEQLLRSAFTSASQELASDEEQSSGSLAASLSTNLSMSASLDPALSLGAASMHGQAPDDMYRLLSGLQQQQPQY